MVNSRFRISTIALLATSTLSSCSIPDYAVPNIVCKKGVFDEEGEWTFREPSLNKSISDSAIKIRVELLTDDRHEAVVVWQSIKPGAILKYGSEFEFKAYPQNAVKSEWDVPADEPWPTDCNETGTATSPSTVVDNSPEGAYKTASRQIAKNVIASLVTLQDLFEAVDPSDQMWILSVSGELLSFRYAYDEAQKLSAPPVFEGAHMALLETLEILNDVSYSLPTAFDSGNLNQIGKHSQRMWNALDGLDKFTKLIN